MKRFRFSGSYCRSIRHVLERVAGIEPVLSSLEGLGTSSIPYPHVGTFERKEGIEPSTFSLATRCSTSELFTHRQSIYTLSQTTQNLVSCLPVTAFVVNNYINVAEQYVNLLTALFLKIWLQYIQ